MGQKLFPWMNPKGVRGAIKPFTAYNADTATANTVLSAALLAAAAAQAVIAMTGVLAAGATATTDTAANILAALGANAYIGQTFTLRIINESTGAFTWTLAGGAGVTVNGTKTMAQNTWRDFAVTVTGLGSSAAVTMQSIGTGTNS